MTRRAKLRLLWKSVVAPLQMLVIYLPGPGGEVLRYRYYKRRLARLGRNVRIEVGVHFVSPSHIAIGDNCWIDKYVIVLAGPPNRDGRIVARCENPLFHGQEGTVVVGENCHLASHALINGHGGVSIGANSTVAAGAKIVSFSHHHENPLDEADPRLYSFGSRAPLDQQALISAAVVMERETALGTNAVMLPGTSIGAWTWVGAQSVVTKAIPANSLAWGVPAKPVATRRGATQA
jgi:acetyltransferase-like isoleucine patch superfamily enzyme